MSVISAYSSSLFPLNAILIKLGFSNGLYASMNHEILDVEAAMEGGIEKTRVSNPGIRKLQWTMAALFPITLAVLVMGMSGGANEVIADPAPEVVLHKNLNDLMPLEQLIKNAEALHPGRLIEAELKSIDGRDLYEIEILDEAGKVWESFYDAQTGEIVDHKEEDH